MNELIPQETIDQRIFQIRGQKVMIDSDLASLYEVETRSLNQAVKRNAARFPIDFMFQLTSAERDEVITFCDWFTKWKYASTMPYVFTESGVAMLSSVLNSDRAALVNVQIIRVFVRLRHMVAENETLRYAIEGLERRMGKNERNIKMAIDAIQSILNATNAIYLPSLSMKFLRSGSADFF